MMALVCSTSAVAATSCKQKNGIYEDDDRHYVLRFYTPEDGQGISSNTFLLEPKNTDHKLDGWVIWQGEPERPEAILNYQCPAGDVTGEELAECRVWQGVIYSVWPDGHTDLLPPSENAAVGVILLPDLGRSLRASPAYEKLGTDKLPWDAFRLTGCAQTDEKKDDK